MSLYCFFVQKYHYEIKVDIKWQLTPTSFFILSSAVIVQMRFDRESTWRFCLIFSNSLNMQIFKYLWRGNYRSSSMVTRVQHIPHNKYKQMSSEHGLSSHRSFLLPSILLVHASPLSFLFCWTVSSPHLTSNLHKSLCLWGLRRL